MAKPRELRWNSTAQRWESAGRDGLVKAYQDETGWGANQLTVGTLATLQAARVGSGPQINFMLGFIGSSASITSVAVGEITIGTITNATGLAVGDKVFGNPKAATLQTGRLGIAAFYVPTTNVLNVHIANLGTVAGSLPAVGWDMFAVRN